MYCGNCGTKLEEGITFCPNCGKQIGAKWAPMPTAKPAGGPAVETVRTGKALSRIPMVVLGLAAMLGLFLLNWVKVAWVSPSLGFEGYSAFGQISASGKVAVGAFLTGASSVKKFMVRSFCLALVTFLVQLVTYIVMLVSKKNAGSAVMVSSGISIAYTVYYLIFGLIACARIDWVKLSFMPVIYLVIVAAQFYFAYQYHHAVQGKEA